MGRYEKDRDQRAPRQAKRRRHKWHYYIPTAIMLVVALVCVGTIGWTVMYFMDYRETQLEDTTLQTTTHAPSDPQGDDTTPTEPQDEDTAVTQLIAQSDLLAAGYDYDAAIQLLKSSDYFTTNTELTQKVEEYTNLKAKTRAYSAPETITHIFFHSLIVDTDRAFDGDSEEGGYNMYMTTVEEFKAILQQMYDRGFVLISPYDMAYEVSDENGTRFVYGDIMLPPGKTPFLMSQDDLNYYSYMVGSGNGKNETPVFNDEQNDGFATRIVIDDDGYPVCEYFDADGVRHVGDYDLVPVLETFIQEHPDFSYRGARAILGMTGYEGVFGYRTKPSYQPELDALHAADPEKYPSYEQEVADAKAVAQCLRDHGWILASHSYGHPAYGNISADRVEADSDKWEATVESIIGETDIILYPHGSDIHTWRNYTFENEKFAALYEDGYRYFFNVDGNTYWNQLGSNYFRGGRRNLDGYRMYHDPDKLSDLFDVASVFSKDRPLPVPDNGSGM
ncbi:MAG: polysaccharide deacetylase [Oscillospiraceae bacterium]|nr:polysaccharide deacetylase [Oscillospiraceae bacterium]